MSVVAGTVEMATESAKQVISTYAGGDYVPRQGEKLIDLNRDPELEGSDVNGEDEVDIESRNRQLAASKLGGLYNEGNTCFMNSVIQSLASLDSFEQFLDKLSGQKKTPSDVLSKLVQQINMKQLNRHTYSTNELVRSMGSEASRWMNCDQEDAQEFFQQVLSFIEKDYKEIYPTEKTRLVTPFDGETAIRVGCLRCGEMEGIRKQVMSSIGVSLSATMEHVHINDLLYEYTQLEKIEDVECYRCSLLAFEKLIREKIENNSKPLPKILENSFKERLISIHNTLKVDVIDEEKYKALKPQNVKELSNKSKQIMFSKPTPKILAIHINRSVFDFNTGYIKKNLSPVSYDEFLDISPFVVGDVEDPINRDPAKSMQAASTYESPDSFSSSSSDTSALEEENDEDLEEEALESTEPIDTVLTNPTQFSDQKPHEFQTSDKTMHYRLKSVVVHYGSHNFGHYISYRRDSRHGIWWRISDQNVNQVDINQVLNVQGVFMLFYEQVEINRFEKNTKTQETNELVEKIEEVKNQEDTQDLQANKPTSKSQKHSKANKKKKGKKRR